MLNIVIPMAGAGSRFSKAGYTDPKPLIPIEGIPMIQVVINNLRPKIEHRFIFICQAAHVVEYGLLEKLNSWAPGCAIVELNGLTEGAACSVLAAKSYINCADQLMIANSDQYVDVDINLYLDALTLSAADGLIMTMTADDPKWSFVRCDLKKQVVEVAEKKVISDEATVGIYNFKYGHDFVRAAESMIEGGVRVNNEFYVAPVYNDLIAEGKIINFFNIGSERNGMYGLGIPEDLNYFINFFKNTKLIEG